jgi:hypothetical protein
MHIIFMLSVGVVDLLESVVGLKVDENGTTSLESSSGEGVEAHNTASNSTSVDNNPHMQRPTAVTGTSANLIRIGAYAANLTQMRFFAQLLTRMFRCELTEAELNSTILPLLDKRFALNLLPVGNKRVVNSKETVVVHWRDVVAESLAFSSDTEVNRKALVFEQFGTKREYIEANPLSVSNVCDTFCGCYV